MKPDRAAPLVLACAIVLTARAKLVAQSASPAPPPPSHAEFVIRPGDALKISVWPDEKLGGQFSVEESGYVYLPVLGRVQATGVSLEALRARLREGYGQLIKSPVVTVTPVFRVGVTGAVNRPGLYTVEPTTNVFDVLLLAGGFTGNAAENDVRILRNGEVLKLEAGKSIDTGDALQALVLQSGDNIVVPARKSIPWKTLLEIAHTGLLTASIIYRLAR